MLDDLGAGGPQQVHEGVMLALGRREVGPGRVVPDSRIRAAEGRVRPAP